MRQSIQIRGGQNFTRKLSSFVAELGRETNSVLAEQARAVAVQLVSATSPPGLQQDGSVKAAKRVDGDVRRVFASRQSPFTVYQMLAAKDLLLAKAYWRAYKKGQTRRMGQILTQAGLPENGASTALLKTARTNPFGGVPSSVIPLSLVRESEVRALSRRQQLLVGTAKAGWHQAAKSLGGRVRRNQRDAGTGKRWTEEQVPEYVRKVSNRLKGLGGSRFNEGPVLSVTIFSNVRHALDAIIITDFDSAIYEGQQRFYKAMAEALHYVRQNTFRTAA